MLMRISIAPARPPARRAPSRRPRWTLHFTQRLEPKFSTIVVRDAGGKQVDKGDSHVSGEDLTVLKASLQPLGSGSYKVEWRVISVDTHATKGEYTFRVGK
jgi:copper resistance protein C